MKSNELCLTVIGFNGHSLNKLPRCSLLNNGIYTQQDISLTFPPEHIYLTLFSLLTQETLLIQEAWSWFLHLSTQE